MGKNVGFTGLPKESDVFGRENVVDDKDAVLLETGDFFVGQFDRFGDGR